MKYDHLIVVKGPAIKLLPQFEEVKVKHNMDNNVFKLSITAALRKSRLLV